MARGWESKSVEDQIASAEAGAAQPGSPPLTPGEQARSARRATLQLARASALQDLQRACNATHRALLEQTLQHLDQALEALDQQP
jgi:hypothetical protein